MGALAVAAFAGAALSKPADPAKAPELSGGPWINTPNDKPITLASRHGKVTLVAFWTFECVNCRNNMPAYARLLAKYRPKGVEMIAVHTPELPNEHDLDQIKAHIKEFKIDYPVLVDNDATNWKRWKVDVWPSLAVIDQEGNIRYHWVGELNYNGAGGEAKVAEMLDTLLAEKK